MCGRACHCIHLAHLHEWDFSIPPLPNFVTLSQQYYVNWVVCHYSEKEMGTSGCTEKCPHQFTFFYLSSVGSEVKKWKNNPFSWKKIVLFKPNCKFILKIIFFNFDILSPKDLLFNTVCHQKTTRQEIHMFFTGGRWYLYVALICECTPSYYLCERRDSTN